MPTNPPAFYVRDVTSSRRLWATLSVLAALATSVCASLFLWLQGVAFSELLGTPDSRLSSSLSALNIVGTTLGLLVTFGTAKIRGLYYEANPSEHEQKWLIAAAEVIPHVQNVVQAVKAEGRGILRVELIELKERYSLQVSRYLLESAG